MSIDNITMTRVPPSPVAPIEKRHEPAGANSLTKKASNEKNLSNKIRDVAKDILKDIKVEQYMNRGISLEIDRDLNIVVVKIVDKESGEVIRQVPLPESIELAKGMKEQLSNMVEEQSGLFIHKEV